MPQLHLAAAAGKRAFFASAGAATALLGGGLAVAACKEEKKPAAASAPHHKVLIVGGGSAGLAVAAQLRNKGVEGIGIVEPSSVHYYQPLWTLVGGGIFPGTKSVRPEKPLIPSGCQLIEDRVVAFDPKANTVTTAGGQKVGYDHLVVAAGLQINWGKIKGLPETIGKNGVVSVYDYEYAQDTWTALQGIKKGRMIFTQPSTAVKCGGAPQKIMWLAEEYVRQRGTREDFEIFFSLPQQKMFGVQKYSDTLEKLAQARGVQRLFGTELVAVDGKNKSAVFKKVADGSQFCMKFDLLHVVPPMGPPDFIAKSPLASKDGYVDVDKHTLRHAVYPNVWAIGDCSSLPTSKTIAAITSEAPVLVHNLTRVLQGKEPTAKYDGYTSCPLVTGYSSLLLAEFKYGGEVAETFGAVLDQAEPRWAFLQMKKYVFPAAYWELFLRGYWYGSRGVIPPSFSDN